MSKPPIAISRSAFSLLETVVSISLLGLIVIFVLNIFPGSLVATQRASEQIEAENLAQSLIEESRAGAFSGFTVGTQNLPQADTRFTVQQEVFVPDGADADQTVGLRYTVSWQSKGKNKNITREIWLSSVRS